MVRTNRDRNWDALGDALIAQSSGKTPRLFSSRRTLFGIPSALDEELARLSDESLKPAESETMEKAPRKNAERVRTGPSIVTHPLDPVFDEKSEILILGTMPSPKSRETGFYYNHPQNRFWKVMAALFGIEAPVSNDAKKQFALDNHIALWDVLAQCEIEGASDGTIANCIANDVSKITENAPIKAIFLTGAKANELFEKYCGSQTDLPHFRLPSTSSANAHMSLNDLIDHYSVIKEWL